MPIFGSLIKKVIELGDSLSASSLSPAEQQEKVLRELLEKARDTAFGKYYRFSEILESEQPAETFAQLVPVFNYDKMHADWWCRTLEGETDVTWPGKPDYFALSSGTTSHSKHIPVTDDMLDSIRRAGRLQIMSLAGFDLPPEFFEKQIMMLGSSIDLKEKDDHLEGDISGISASRLPFWFRGYYKPGADIARIDDWDTRVERIAEKARDWDIGSLAGIPAWMELMLKRVIEYHGVETIHDIWPNLTVYASGGVALGPYKASLEKLTARPLVYVDTYLASEGFLAFQNRPGTESMKLVTDNGIYFEFVPFDENTIQDDGSLHPDSKALTIGQVAPDVEYVLLISTVTGAWRYTIGDTVRFTDVERGEIVITGRTKFFLNVEGSQLSVNQMEQGVQELNKTFDLDITEFTLASVRQPDGFYIHQWYLGTSSEASPDPLQLAAHLDQHIRDHNKNYNGARGKLLKEVQVQVVPARIFHEWHAAKKKMGGQVKMARVMKEEEFAEWEAFAQAHLEGLPAAASSAS